VEIFDEERRIKPGMFGRISVVYDVHENALQIPRSAIVEETDTLSVFVVEDNLAVRKSVTTGYGNRGMIEIISGIEDEEQVVIVGQVSLKQDSKVTVINQADTEELAADMTDEDAGQQVSDNAPTD
jgi:membrane fusion protein (multidrug efflux system)